MVGCMYHAELGKLYIQVHVNSMQYDCFKIVRSSLFSSTFGQIFIDDWKGFCPVNYNLSIKK